MCIVTNLFALTIHPNIHVPFNSRRSDISYTCDILPRYYRIVCPDICCFFNFFNAWSIHFGCDINNGYVVTDNAIHLLFNTKTLNNFIGERDLESIQLVLLLKHTFVKCRCLVLSTLYLHRCALAFHLYNGVLMCTHYHHCIMNYKRHICKGFINLPPTSALFQYDSNASV